MVGAQVQSQPGPIIAVLFSTLLSLSAHAQTVPGCGSLNNAYGPFDYTNPNHFKNKLPIVEKHHFSPEIERLKQDPTYGGHFAEDIDYTLRAFPNHHRALQSMAQYELKARQSPPPKSSYTAVCWFKRAIAFRPEDGVVRMIFGTFLHKSGDLPGALREYQASLGLMGDYPNLHYNLGLLYFDRREYGLAYDHAVLAYDAGFPLPGLKNKLKSVGHWGKK